MREQNTIMFHWATPRSPDVLNADCDREDEYAVLERSRVGYGKESG